MPIAGSMQQWQGRIGMATDAELATLDDGIAPDSPLRPIISDEILRRSVDKGADVSAVPVVPTATTPPDAVNIPVTIPTAPPNLAAVPGAPPPPANDKGGPSDDVRTLASRALNAAQEDDQKTALELYDYGLQKHGNAFLETFNTLKHDREVADSTRNTVPTSAVSPTEGQRLASGLRSLNPPQPVPVPTDAAEKLPVVRPESLVKIGDAAGYSTATPPPTGYKMTLSGLPRPGTQAGRDDQENPVPAGELPPGSVPSPDQPVVPPLSTDGPLPVVRPESLVKIGDAAGYPTGTPPPTGYEMTLHGMPHTAGGKGGIAGAGGFPGSAAGRDDQEANPPGLPREVQGPPWQPSGVEMERALRDPTYRRSIIPEPDQPVVVPGAPQIPVVRPDRNESNVRIKQALRGSPQEEAVARGVPLEQVETERAAEMEEARTADAARNPPTTAPAAPPATTPPATTAPTTAGLRSVPGGRTAAGTAEGTQRLDDPDVATRGPTVSPDGTVTLPEDTVTVVKKTGLPARTVGGSTTVTPTTRAGVGSTGTPKPAVADPGSGGVSSTVTPHIPLTQMPDAPAVDTGTNNNPPITIDEGFMGKPDIWSFLTSAGLGAMASGSTSFLGAIGAGGKAGIDQLSVLRKEQRERAKALADAEFQRERIKLGYRQEAGQDRRTTQQVQSNEKIAEYQQGGMDRRQGKEIGATRENLIIRNEHERQQAERASELKKLEADYADHIKDQNLKDDMETRHKFAKDHGASDEDANYFAFGHTPPADRRVPFSPMGEKESAAAYEGLAGTVLGQGRTFDEINSKLAPDHRIELQQEMAKGQSVPDAIARGQAVLKKYGYTTKDNSWLGGLMGEHLDLVAPRTPPAGAAGGGSSTGSYVWVPGKGVVAK